MQKIRDDLLKNYLAIGADKFNIYMSMIILSICLSINFIGIALIYYKFGETAMYTISVVVGILFLSNIIVVRKGKYEISYYIMLGLIIGYIFFKVKILGVVGASQTLLIYFIVPQFTYNFSKKNKIIINVVSISLMFYLTFNSYTAESIQNYNRLAMFAKFNIVSLYFILFIQLMSSKFIRILIDNVRETELQYFKDKSTHDELTGLTNRFYAQRYFEKMNQKIDRRYIIALFDIDNFKSINDTYGHQFGDEVLKSIAEKINLFIVGNGMACRWGGEEFLIVLEDIPKEKAIQILNDLREKISMSTLLYQNEKINVTITIGVAEVNNSNIMEAIDVADKKLYEGKNSGKNKVVI